MKIFIKALKGNHFQIQVKPQDTHSEINIYCVENIEKRKGLKEHPSQVHDVKKNIESVKGANVYPASQQILIYQGKILTDGSTLEENNIAANSFLVVTRSKSKSLSGESSVEAEATAASATTAIPISKSKSLTGERSEALAAVSSALAAAAAAMPTSKNKSLFGGRSEAAAVGSSAPSAAAMPTSTALATPVSPVKVSNMPPTTVTNESLPASTPTSVQAPIISSSETKSDTDGQRAPDLVAGNGLENTIQHMLDMGGGNWDRDTVVRALCAASNNPERAVEWLYSANHAEVPSLTQSIGAGQPGKTSSVSQQPRQSSGSNADHLNIFPQGLSSLGSDAAPSGALDFLHNSEQFQALRAMVQVNPEVLQPMLQELEKQNPNLMRFIQEHPIDFHRLLNEPVEGKEGNILQQLAGAMPQAIQVTAKEQAAIERLEAMGFGRSIVLEVYFACNKNEELTANYLLDHMHEFEE